MSLRYQINLRILILSGCIVLLGSYFAIWQARNSVSEEVESSIHLAVELITLDFAKLSQSADAEADWLPKFNALKQTRHLLIQLTTPDGQLIGFNTQNPIQSHADMPPAWFINLVKGQYPKIERQLRTHDGRQLLLVIQANPLDEITEAWHESITFFCSLFLLTVLIFLAVNLVFNKAFKAIVDIVDVLKVIETGDYQQKLPTFSTQEYDSIAKAINHMTGELDAAKRQNRNLTLHSLTIQEDERQRLSQELHDELGQSLTAIKVMAVTVARKPENAKPTTDSIISICDHLIHVVRTMMRQLHPLVLTELGLRASLEDLINHWHIRNPSLKLSLNCDESVDELDHQYTIQVFRVIQECLTNIVRHAQATEATIDLRVDQDISVLKLVVSDNGQGCSLDSLTSGFGLLGMRERINSLGGEMFLNTRPQQGMQIKAHIPLS